VDSDPCVSDLTTLCSTPEELLPNYDGLQYDRMEPVPLLLGLCLCAAAMWTQ
jgi:hypothetical protein